MRIALGVEYDGSGFKGWQCQPGQRTVQDRLEQATARVANHPVSIVTAGRTDTGVHASGQVAHFDTDARRDEYQWLRGINTNLPDDVSLLWVRAAPGEFHARFSAVDRTYRYIILNRQQPPALLNDRVAWDHRKLDIGAMREASVVLLGEHDFSSFRSAGCQAKDPVRTVSRLQIGHFDNWIWFDIVANAFLQHMVRNIVGSLVMVGAGEKPVDWIGDVLARRDRTCAGVTAPAAGLYLTSVRYPMRFGLPSATGAVRYW